jgi:aspartyl-tRNA(Asn)/glutamyl-tRNA(Gln) amidotransferase subunit A
VSADAAIPVGVSAVSAALARGEITSVALTQAYLDRIAARDPALNSFITRTPELALQAAAASDDRRARGQALGPLDGAPLAIKDNIDVAGVPTTGGIGARRGRTAEADAPVIARLKTAGAVILGKLNMHEAAHGGTTANVAYGLCHNPHRHGYSPGGSSGGSAAAVAAGLCAGALGTDTLGSVRLPAAFCGVAGFKPTQGLVSTRGVLPLCWTLDHVGALAPRVGDLRLMIEAMAGFDANDPVALQVPSWMSLPTGHSPRGLRIGCVDLTAIAGAAIDSEVAGAYARAIALLRDLGTTAIDVTLPNYDARTLRGKAMLMMEADLAIFYADDLARDPEGFTPELRQGVEYGRAQSAPKLAEAYRLIRALAPMARAVFTEVDALVMPTTPFAAFPFTQAMPKNIAAFTALANYIGAPAATVPMGKTADGLPLGLQIVAPAWDDARVLNLAEAYEAAAAHDMAPFPA